MLGGNQVNWKKRSKRVQSEDDAGDGVREEEEEEDEVIERMKDDDDELVNTVSDKLIQARFQGSLICTDIQGRWRAQLVFFPLLSLTSIDGQLDDDDDDDHNNDA